MNDWFGLRKKMRDYYTVPVIHGDAFCTHCGHEWYTMQNVGTVEMLCPACGRMTGLFRYPCMTESVIHCGVCGNYIYTLSEHGAVCYQCGRIAEYMRGSSRI